MEDLFSTHIAVDNKKIVYRVIFEHEKYVFVPDAQNRSFQTFSFRREHDNWVEDNALPEDIKQQALNALDRYLLKQH